MNAVSPDGSRFLMTRVANPELSRNGQRLAVQRTLRQNVDIWTVDLTRNPSFVRLTEAPGIESLLGR